MRLAHSEHPPGPVQQGVLVAVLRLDIDRGEPVDRVHDRWQHEIFRIGARESAIAVGRPLHRRAHTVAVAQMDVVAHADLVAVIDHRRAGHRQQQPAHQFDASSVMFQQRCQTTPNAQIEPRAPVARIGVPEIVTLLVGDHLQRQLVVVAQEHDPLAIVRNFRCLAHDIGDWEAIFLGDRHIHPRHQREMERHVAFVAIAEILLRVLRPLVGLRQ
jgi:hypothetical protein